MQPFLQPPVVRTLAARSLDRALFAKTVPTAAALVHDHRTIAQYRSRLLASDELLKVPKLSPVHADADRRWLLLRPRVRAGAPETWSATLGEAVKAGELEVVPWEVRLDYDFWSYLDVMKSILPEDLHDEIPVGFNTAGHVAHLNLRGPYLPYRHLIAEVLIDKNAIIRTVINKVDDVGAGSAFRTFPYEVLAGPDDLRVEVSANGCAFAFDYGQVYWNSRLNTEHRRLLDLFRPGELVCDVMAGVGPFAVPAGRKGVFVMANDLNPSSYEAMTDAIGRNKVSEYVRPFNEDGGAFIARSGEMVLEASRRGDCATIWPKARRGRGPAPEPTRIPLPPTVSHYVMNLPGSAITFLHSFIGVYAGHDQLFAPHTDAPLPLVHVYCFCSEKEDGDSPEAIRRRIQAEIGVLLEVGDGTVEGHVTLEDVRDVAPNKRMFCATFRLPREVAFSARTGTT